MSAVAAITLVIYPLREISLAASMGVAYLLAVLLVSTIWGLWLGVLTRVASAAAFNFFHLPPTGRFTLVDSEHWVALRVVLVAAVVASEVAELASSRASEAEQRRREADLAAELERMLLGGASFEAGLDDASNRLADALGLRSAAIELGEVCAGEAELAFDLRRGDEVIGALVVRGQLSPPMRDRLRERVVPALEALLAAALERERLQAEVVETRALRRSDELKTALLAGRRHREADPRGRRAIRTRT